LLAKSTKQRQSYNKIGHGFVDLPVE